MAKQSKRKAAMARHEVDAERRADAARANRRGNKELQAQALALSMHSWNNSPDDWARLADCVTQLGAAAPAVARRLVESRQRSMKVLANPFG